MPRSWGVGGNAFGGGGVGGAGLQTASMQLQVSSTLRLALKRDVEREVEISSDDLRVKFLKSRERQRSRDRERDTGTNTDTDTDTDTDSSPSGDRVEYRE